MPHVHVGVPEFVTFVAQLVIALFLLRIVAARLVARDSVWGKALAFVV